jgi:diguanylate cyclase (GGDEF)-like protein
VNDGDASATQATIDPPLRRRIGRRLAFWTGGAAVLMIAVVVSVVVPIEKKAVERVASDQVGLLAEAVAATYQVVAAPEDDDEKAEPDDAHLRVHRATEVVSELARAPNVRFVDVADHDGVVQVSTAEKRRGQKRPPPRRLRDVDIGADELVVSYAIPWTKSCAQCHAANQDPIGVVQVGVERGAALAGLEEFHATALVAVVGIFAVLVLLILALTDRLIARPVFRLARLMRRAEKGDFLVRAHAVSDDEVGALGKAFDKMLSAITDMKASEIEREAALHRAELELSVKGQLEEFAKKVQESNEALERRVRAQELLMEAAHRLGSTLDKDALIERLARLVTEKLGWVDFAVFLVVEGPQHEAVLRAVRTSGSLDRDDLRELELQIGENITGLVAETGAPVHVPDLTAPPPIARRGTTPLGPPLDHGSLLSVPMLHQGRVVGVLDFYDESPAAFDEDDVALLQALGAQAAMAVVNADLYQTTLELSVTDPLTGLMNRRALARALEVELVRAQRFGTPLAVCMLDVDHFKQYNDRMGHLLGDEALKAVARALEATVRKVDSVARFGGEEFCVVLPKTEEVAGLDVAKKLLDAIRALDVPGAAGQPLGKMSISVGVAVYPADLPAAIDSSPSEVILGLADQAAYEAKRRGRDRILTASEVSGQSRRPKWDEPGRVATKA